MSCGCCFEMNLTHLPDGRVKTVDDNTEDFVNWLLEFKDEDLREDYVSFKVMNSSLVHLGVVATILSIVMIIYWILVFWYDQSPLRIVTSVVSVIPIMLMWIQLIYRAVIPIDSQLTKHRQLLKFTEIAIVVGFTVGGVLVFLDRILHGQCESLSFSRIWYCNPVARLKGLPGDITFSLIILPLLFKLILPFIPLFIIALSFATNVIFILIAIAITSSSTALSTVLMITFLIAATGYCYRIQHMELFIYVMRYQKALQLRSIDYAERTERLRLEMGNILACICHDLTSPLAALSHGLDMLKDVVFDTSKVPSNTSNNKIAAENNHQSTHKQPQLPPLQPPTSNSPENISDTVESIISCYQMLLMSIHRCSDYCKLMYQVPLVSHAEIIPFQDLLQSAIRSLNLFQEDHEHMQLVYYDPQIYPFILTDRQWLQDNLLCIFSNAVKFSRNKAGNIRVFLTTYPSEDAYCKQDVYANEMSGRWMIRIEVSDSGFGMSEVQCANLFEAPDFASQQRKQGGAGVGLYCLAERVKVLKGQFGVHSSQEAGDHGSMFWFTFPYEPAQESTNSMTKCPDNHAYTTDTVKYSSNKQTVTSMNTLPAPVSVNTSAAKVASVAAGKGLNPSKEPQNLHESSASSSSSSSIGPNRMEEQMDLPVAVMKKSRILVVDDSLPILRMLRNMLEKQGYVVDTAKNGLEAISMLKCPMDAADSIKEECKQLGPQEGEQQQQMNAVKYDCEQQQQMNAVKYDCVLMDLQMPIMDGFEAVRQFRSWELQKEALSKPYATKRPTRQLIIAMSANSDRHTVQQAFDAGVDQFIPKPVNLTALKYLLNA